MMKKIIVFVIVFVFVGCYVKGIRKKAPVQQVMLNGISLEKEMKTYTLEIPETWYSYKEVHDHIMHSPQVMQKRSDNHFENNFYVTELYPTETKAKSIEVLFEFYHKKMKGFYPTIDFIPQKLNHKKYGEYYLIKYGSFFGGKNKPTTQIDILFHYKNRNFELRYISENKYYDEFINDVEQIVKSFKIKEPN
jgi:hypothetical protein